MQTEIDVARELGTDLETFERQVESLEVKDAPSYTVAQELIAKAKRFVRRVGEALDPGIRDAKEHYDFLRAERDKRTAVAQRVIETLGARVAAWRTAERENAAREAENINEKARLEARANHSKTPPPVTVLPDIPVVPGTQRRINYRFTVVDPSKVGAEFLVPDLVRIGQKVRSDKDPAKSMREIGGISVVAEG